MAAKLTRLTHEIAIQRELYHIQFSFQAASPETFGYTLVLNKVRPSENVTKRWDLHR